MQSIPHDGATPMVTIEHVRELLANRVPHRDALAVERDEAVTVS